MLKLSEHTPRFSALFESLVAGVFRADEVVVVNGDAARLTTTSNNPTT